MTRQMAQLYDFTRWVRRTLKRSAAVEMNIWSHCCEEVSFDDAMEYHLWISGILNKSFDSLEQVLIFIKKFKHNYEFNKEILS